MKLSSVWLVLGLAGAVLVGATATPARAELTDQRVQQAIDRLVEQIYQMRGNGDWAEGLWDPTEPEGGDHVHGRNWGGMTALMTYALLTAGESYQNPKLQRAIEFLKKAKMTGVYAVGLRAHVWAALPDKFKGHLKDDVAWLLQAQHPKGHYNYTANPGKEYDNSVTQYGVLGVWEGAKRGLAIPSSYWQKVERHFVRSQQEGGGWLYRPGRGNVRGSMTAAGLACLYITQDYMHARDYRGVGQTKGHPLQKHINAGLDWFAENFEPNKSPGGGHNHYYQYGVERVGLASGVKTFGQTNWYRSAARYLVNHPGKKESKAFSLMFLVRGRVPVVMNKLKVPGLHWNNRPFDVANLVSWASDTTEQKLLWQVVKIGRPPQTWLDAPMLYLASHQALDLTDAQKAKLKRYVNMGGMLVLTADNASGNFTRSARDLLNGLHPDHRIGKVGADDPLMNMVFKLSGNRLGVQSLHNGIRHMALLVPRDISWTLHSDSHDNPRPWKFLLNAYYYATEKGRIRPRLSDHYVERADDGGGPAVTVGRAKHAGNWNSEPAAWRIQSNWMYNRKKADATVERFDLKDLPDPADVPFMHVAGTGKTELSEAQVRAAIEYARAGGVILFENAGGGGKFADAAMRAINGALEGKRFRPISTNAMVLSGEGIGGYDLSSVGYRPYATLRMGQLDNPRLLGVSFGGKPRIILSGDDLTQAMLDQPVWGVFGYSSDTARKMMSNLVLYARHIAPSRDAPANKNEPLKQISAKNEPVANRPK